LDKSYVFVKLKSLLKKLKIRQALSGRCAIQPKFPKFLSRLQPYKMSTTTVTAKNTKSSSKKASATTDTSALLERFNALAAEMETIRKSLPAVLGIKKRRTVVPSEDGAPEVARSAWQEWAATCAKRFAADYATHIAELGKKADVMGFAAKCRSKTHVAEWTEHETAWDEAHPKPVKEAKPKGRKSSKTTEMVDDAEDAALTSNSSSNSSSSDALPRASSPPPSKKATKSVAKKVAAASSDDEASSSASKKKPKKGSPPSSEDEAESKSKPKKSTKADEKAAAKKAATEAAAAAASADPPTPSTYRGKQYLKNTANQVWTADDGELGSWVGVFDGKKLEKSDGPATA